MKLLALRRIAQQEDINFLLTNRIPRILLTRLMGRFSKVRQPLVRDASIAAWRLFTDLDLGDAKKTRFESLHDCFTRELKPGARPVETDPAVLCSPCDGIVGACGAVQGTTAFQAKGFPYEAVDLFGNAAAFEPFRDGTYVTLRLTSAMYHRFHAPHDLRIERVTHLAGDTWNVNPIALRRVERLFCRNERALVETRLTAGGHPVAIVPVAAILVAGIRLHGVGALRGLGGGAAMAMNVDVRKGDEMGWFEHGSTILVFAPQGFVLSPSVVPGERLRAGEPLMRLP